MKGSETLALNFWTPPMSRMAILLSLALCQASLCQCPRGLTGNGETLADKLGQGLRSESCLQAHVQE